MANTLFVLVLFSLLASAVLICVLLATSLPPGRQQTPWHGTGAASAERLAADNARAYRHLTEAAMRARPNAIYKSHTKLAWSEFAQDQEAHSYAVVLLRNADFADGTLCIDVPVLLKVTEDIVFSPNEDNRGYVKREQLAPNGSHPARRGFALGFFAAIVVRAENVTIDLGGHEIRQSPVFAVRQGFYTHISVSSLPFLMNEGPADLGTANQAAVGLLVHNGRLGYSSHHGFHGHSARNVTLLDLTLADYEVAAVSMNGWRDVYAHNVHALRSFRSVPVRGTFTQARFGVMFLEMCASHLSQSSSAQLRAAGAECERTRARLVALMDQVEADVASNGFIDAQAHPEAHTLFASRSGHMLDGGAIYGWIISDRGAAVHAFGAPYTEGEGSDDILLDNCSIRGVVSNATEAVSPRYTGTTQCMHGFVGEVFDLHRILHEPGAASDALIEAELALADAHNLFAQFAPEAERNDATLRRHLFNTANISAEIIQWARGGAEPGALATLFRSGHFEYQFDVDPQKHTPKGSFGVRIDSSARVTLRKFAVDGVEALGHSGLRTVMPGQQIGVDWIDPRDYTFDNGGHPRKELYVGYAGGEAHGILEAGCVGVHYDSVTIDGVHSATSRAQDFKKYE